MGKALIQTATSTDPKDVTDEVIFVPDTMPPEEDGPATSPERAKPERPVRQIEKLTFVGKQPSRAVPLEFPFEHPTLGVVENITVRRLSVGEVGDMLDERPDMMPDFFDIYERMTGVPAAVLRGLVDVDGEAVSGVCFDFLPRLYRPILSVASSSTSETGEQ